MIKKRLHFKNDFYFKCIITYLLKDGFVHELQSEAKVSNVLYDEAEILDITSSCLDLLDP
jgi:hypothetical protein